VTEFGSCDEKLSTMNTFLSDYLLQALVKPTTLALQQWRILGFGKGEHRDERKARTYNGSLGVEAPAGCRGRTPGQGTRVKAPLKLKHLAFGRSM